MSASAFMSRQCAACDKVVYPTEELRCFDRLWHKSCFRCAVCKKVLGMHNFKGFEGKPYCTVHYPQMKSSVPVINTPEMQQVAINTKNMSKYQYHRDYENSKGRPKALGEGGKSFSQDIEFNQAAKAPTTEWQQPQGINAHTVPKDEPVERNGEKRVGEAAEEEEDDGLIYRPDLKIVGGMRVTGSGLHFQAVYNYEAAEDDEVSLIEGDEIIDGEPIDEGWMYGTVRRTGKFGMLPSNYVVPLQKLSLNH